MSDKGKQQAMSELNNDTLKEEDLATHQEAIPIPFIFGTQNVALRWLTQAIDRTARQAPQDRPGKK